MGTHNQDKKDRQLDNLINLVENHTRTERHLEQYSNIGSKDNKKHARDVQDDREEQIDILKNKLNGNNDIQTPDEQLVNLKEKYLKTNDYIRNNRETMTDDMLQHMGDKQQKRKNQIDNLENN